MFAHEARWQLRILLRDRTAAFFTLVFPLVLLFLLIRQVGRENEAVLSMGITVAVVMASFPALAISLAAAIEYGVLHRLRSTPLSTGVHLAGRMAASGALAAISVALILVAAYFLGIAVGWPQLLWLLVPLLLGWAVASTWGLFVGAYARKTSTASFLTQILLFPLYILEGFLISGGLPDGLAAAARWSPLHQLVELTGAAIGGDLTAAWLPAAYLVLLGFLGFVLAVARLRAAR